VTRRPERVIDVGLQAERTYLAWTRTGLTFVAIAVLLLRRAVLGNLWLLLFGVPAAVTAALILARAQWRYRVTVTKVQKGRSAAAPRLVAAIAAASGVVAVGGLASVLFTR
jgi:putative membrane protein